MSLSSASTERQVRGELKCPDLTEVGPVSMAVSLPVAGLHLFSLLLTSDKVLLGWAVDARQVAVVFPAVLLGVLPRVSPAEVAVAVAVELSPGVVAALRVWVGV